MRTLALSLTLASLAVLPLTASAESPWSVKAGFSQINPKSNNGSLAGGAIPFKHDVKDTKSDTKIASFKHLPPTFTAKYLFTPDAAFSPYVGLGLNYTLVYDEKIVLAGAKLRGKDSFGLAATVGFEYRMPNSPWGVAADLRYINIESDLTLNGADIGTLTVDPMVLGLSAVYHY